MNNSNFGFDCRNNLDNCKFVPIFDEYKEITFINQHHNIFDSKISEFVTADLQRVVMKENLTINYRNLIKKIDFMKLNSRRLNQNDYHN